MVYYNAKKMENVLFAKQNRSTLENMMHSDFITVHRSVSTDASLSIANICACNVGSHTKD